MDDHDTITSKHHSNKFSNIKSMISKFISHKSTQKPLLYDIPIVNLFKSTVKENIISHMTYLDLLSLYLTDKNFYVILNTFTTLRFLSIKFKISIPNDFSQFVKIMQNGSFKRLYLYDLENVLYKPQSSNTIAFAKDYTCKNRILLLDWLLKICKTFNSSEYLFGLTVTLLDVYTDFVSLVNDNIQLTGCVCMYIASTVIEEYMLSICDFIHATDHIYNSDQFNDMVCDVMCKLNGTLIRPSTVFFTNMFNDNAKTLTYLSYFSHELSTYNSSLIAHMIHYVLTGEYDPSMYTLMEIAAPCKILINQVRKLIHSSLGIRNLAICSQKYFQYNHVELVNSISAINKTVQISQPPCNRYSVNKFDRICTIGHGVSGKVYKVKNRERGEYYVLKSIKNQLPSGTIEIANLKLLAGYQYIILSHGFDMNREKLHMYLNVGLMTLAKLADNTSLMKYNMITYFKQIALAVNYCHQHDVIHRDIKPDNIIFDGEKVVLIDFGLAVNYASFRTVLAPSLAGTPKYRAPEAFLGDIYYNHKIDIWSLGLVFYFMINNKHLISRTSLDKQILIDIFEIFGTPSKVTWPDASALPNWNDFKNYQYKGNNSFLRERLAKYYDLAMLCLKLNPVKRADITMVLTYLNYKLYE